MELNKYGVEVPLDLKKEPNSPRLVSFEALRASLEKSYSLLSPALQSRF